MRKMSVVPMLVVAMAMILTTACASNSGLIVKGVDVRDNSAEVQFQPGCVKYIAEYRSNKTTLTPNSYGSAWGEGVLGVGRLSSFRFVNGSHDQLWVTAKNEKVGEDMTVNLTCFLKDGTTTSKKVRIIRGEPGLVSMDDGEIVISLQQQTKDQK